MVNFPKRVTYYIDSILEKLPVVVSIHAVCVTAYFHYFSSYNELNHFLHSSTRDIVGHFASLWFVKDLAIYHIKFVVTNSDRIQTYITQPAPSD